MFLKQLFYADMITVVINVTIICMELYEHLYTCHCPDFNRICKHIHQIHSHTSRSSFQQYNSNSSLCDTIPYSPGTPLNDNQLQEGATSPSRFHDHNKQILEFYQNLVNCEHISGKCRHILI